MLQKSLWSSEASFEKRLYLTTEVAIKVYQAMILPLMTYGCIINMHLTTSQSDRLSSIGRRVRQIGGETNNFPDIQKTMKRDICIFVKKRLNKKLCRNFDNYFDIIEHNKRTRQGFLLRLPVIKLESTKN